ncbi:MAG: Xylose transport system permease protein XylH [Actinomycetota bacterium]|jgi:D-xylose transport system permease protein
MSNVKIATGHEGSAKDQINAYFQRVKSGDMGALPAVGALIVLIGIFTAAAPEYFLRPLNVANLFVQAAELTMLAAAMVFVILLAEIDLSAGVTGGVAMAVMFLLLRDGVSWPIALIVALVVGAAIGLLIGFFVAKVGVPSFVVTLGLFLGFQGLQLVMLGDGGLFKVDVAPINAIMNENLPTWLGWLVLIGGLALGILITFLDRARRAKNGLPNRPISLVAAKYGAMAVLGGIIVAVMNVNRSANAFKPIEGVPIVIPITLGILLIGGLILDRTRFGRHLYAVGGNPEAARRAGIKVAKIRIIAFIVCSALSVISGLFHVSRLGAVEATAGRTIVLSGVAAAVVGGVSLFGGKGRLMHAAIGALVITIIANGLGLLGWDAGMNFLVTGGVLILAATVDALSRKRSSSSQIRV